METTKHKIIREPKHIETVYKDKDGIIYSERIFFWEVITIKKENINRKSDFEDEYSFFTTITPIGAYGEAPLYFWSDDTVDCGKFLGYSFGPMKIEEWTKKDE